MFTDKHAHIQIQGPVVQSWVSANPGLKFDLFKFMYFCTSIYFKASEKKTPIDPDKIPEKNISTFINKLLGNLV